jgi:hypothetical protein
MCVWSGLIPKWRDLDSKNALANATQGINTAEEQMGCVLEHRPSSVSLTLLI